ncbi:MAG TPA: InlB B-repeat-containing protein, partial [Spirochaetota bacterium]|nr:InlB B-repeat-containing protein [Spirochaetota bacterium]
MKSKLGLLVLLFLASFAVIPSCGGGGGGSSSLNNPSLSGTFSVIYDANNADSGSVPVDETEYASGESVTVLGNTGNLVKGSLAFVGWNTSSDGSGSAYAAGSSFEISSNITLYAQWSSAPTFSVTYNGNGNTGGSVPVDGNAYLSGASVTAENKGTLVKSGFTFVGWNTAANGSGLSYAAGASFAISSNITLYAQWSSASTFSVTYAGNGNTGGGVPVDGNAYLSGASVTAANKGTLVKSGYTFAGWNTAANGSGSAHAAGSSFEISSNITLYAQWTADPTFSVTYNGNGSTGGGVPVDVNAYLSGASVTAANKGTLVKSGYT